MTDSEWEAIKKECSIITISLDRPNEPELRITKHEGPRKRSATARIARRELQI